MLRKALFVAALACSATIAHAQTNPGHTPRTYDVRNVFLDFNADPAGVKDSTAAIQSAFTVGSSTAATTVPQSGAVLTFSAVPSGVGLNYFVYDQTNPDALSNFEKVAAVGATTITLAHSGGTVAQGDVIQFLPPNRGTIYFPCGTYKLLGSVDLTRSASFLITGDGGCSIIQGNVAGYLFDRNLQDAVSGVRIIERLIINNTNPAGGAIRMNGVTGTTTIRDSTISAAQGVHTDSNATDVLVQNVQMTWNRSVNSIGFAMDGNSMCLMCDIVGYDSAITAFSQANVIIGGRFEVNNIGINLGTKPDNITRDFCGNCIVEGLTTEANGIGVWARNVAHSTVKDIIILNENNGRIQPNATLAWSNGTVTVATAVPHGVTNGTFLVDITGASPAAYNATQVLATRTGPSGFTYPLVSDPGVSAIPGSFNVGSLAGLQIDTASYSTFQDMNPNGACANACVIIGGSNQNVTLQQINANNGYTAVTGAPAWSISPSAGVRFVQTNMPAPVGWTWALRPFQGFGVATEGSEWLFTDSTLPNNSTALGQPVTGGGGTTRVHVRWSANSGQWIAVALDP